MTGIYTTVHMHPSTCMIVLSPFFHACMYIVRCTPMDLAVINSHIDCMDVLTQGGALTTTEIRSLAAVSLQTAYRAYR